MTNLTLSSAELTQIVTSAVTSALAEVMTLTAEPSVPATKSPKSRSRKAAPKGRKTGSKTRRVRGPNSRTGYAGNIAEFGEAAGYGDSLEGWTLVEVLDHLIAEGDENWEDWMPEGWTFGPASAHYLAEGEWPTK